jgi:hypothetical protein
VAVFGADADGVGASPVHLWAPRRPFVRVTASTETCSVCAERRFKNDACLVAGHPCMVGVSVAQVRAFLDDILPDIHPRPAGGSKPREVIDE